MAHRYGKQEEYYVFNDAIDIAVVPMASRFSATNEQAEANAHLIAAAPALAGKLHGVIEMARSVAGNWENGNLAHAVRNLQRVADEAEALLASIE